MSRTVPILQESPYSAQYSQAASRWDKWSVHRGSWRDRYKSYTLLTTLPTPQTLPHCPHHQHYHYSTLPTLPQHYHNTTTTLHLPYPPHIPTNTAPKLPSCTHTNPTLPSTPILQTVSIHYVYTTVHIKLTTLPTLSAYPCTTLKTHK